MTTYYAWTNSDYNATIYTDTLTPTVASSFYDSEGNDITSCLNCADCGINNITPTTIVWGVGGKDYTIPPTSTVVRMGTYNYNRDLINDITDTKYISNLSNGTDTYVIKDAEARTAIANKQDTLVSGTNIKTINNQSILGSGDITIDAEIDNKTITKNGDNELQTVAIVNPNTNSGAISPLKIWNGTERQWINGEATVWNYWQTNVQAMWTDGGSIPTDVSWYKAYGNNRFVCVAYNSNQAMYSTDDGLTWNNVTLPVNSLWTYGITFGGGIFLLADYTKRVYSTDGGETWTYVSAPNTGPSHKPVFGGGSFVITHESSGGVDATITYSKDNCATWHKTSSILPNVHSWSNPAYGNGRFVAIYSSTVIYSDDGGETWTRGGDLSSSGSWYGPVFSDGTFVCVKDNSNECCYSTDGGETWNSSTLPTVAHWRNIYCEDGIFIAIAYFSSNVARSINGGMTWNSVSGLPSRDSMSIAYGNNIFLCTISNSNKSYYSTDGGETWNSSTLPAVGYWNLTYGNNKFISSTSTYSKSVIFDIQYNKCYTLDSTPTTSSQVYSEPETTSTKTITSIGSGTITLSDNLVYNSTPTGNQNTYRTLGAAHPDWLCNINNVGVKIGNTIIATDGSDLLPSQSGQSGKYLTTNGTTASWTTVPLPEIDTELSSTSTNSVQNRVINSALNNKANDSSVVHLSGDETINGGKTFNQAFIIGTTETHPNEGGQLIFKKSHNSTMAGDVIVDQNVNNLRVIGQSTSLGIIVPFYIDCENNKVYTATPATGDNSTQVATTAFVKAQGYATTSQIPTIDQTYNASSSNAQSGTAVASAISSAISSVYKPAGSVVFANLPTPSASNEGNVYNVTNAFTTTSSFVEGAGINYPAGTNVVIINTGNNTYKFDTLTGAFQPLLVSGTNIKTINSNSILGSGNLDIDALPSQTNNSGKFLTTNGTTASWGNVTIPFGESTSAADAVQKEVTISEITELKTGQIIIVKPTITSTVAESTLKLNNFTAYPMLYGSSAISTSTDSIVWQANYPSWFRFNGSNWLFIGHGAETTYSAMSVAEGTTGTATTARSMRADRLKQIIQGTTLTGLSTSTSSAVTEADTVTTGIGKLQAQIPTTATTSTTGLVKPDGTTITITNDGTISASAGSYAMVIVDYTEEE